MPYRRYYVKALQELNKVNKIDYNERVLAEPMYNIIRAQDNPEKIDELIRNQFVNRYVEEGAKVEKKRQEMMLLSKAKPNKKKLVEDAKKIHNPATFAFNLMDILQHAANGMAHLERKQDTYQSVPFFGFDADQVVELMQKQVDSYSYREGRKFELFKAYGILDQRFLNEAKELDEIVKNNKNYVSASDEEKEKIHRTYITKKLVEEELNSHIFIWKWFHGAEVKAMNEYIKTAGDLLKSVELPGENEEHFPADEVNATANKGFAMSDPSQRSSLEKIFVNAKNKANEKIQNGDRTQREAAMKRIEDKSKEDKRIAEEKLLKEQREKEAKEQEAETNAIKNAEKKQRQQDKINLDHTTFKREEIDKKPGLKEKIAEAQSKPLPQRLFETYYRPSSDPEEFEKEKAAFKEWKETAKNLPNKAMRRTFAANSLKAANQSSFNKTAFANEMQRKTKENELVIAAHESEVGLLKTFEGYKAPTESELMEILALQDQLKNSVNDKKDVQIEPPKAENDQQVKAIENPINQK